MARRGVGEAMLPVEIRIVGGVGLWLWGISWTVAITHPDGSLPWIPTLDFLGCGFLSALMVIALLALPCRWVMAGILPLALWLLVSPWVLEFTDRPLLLAASLSSGGVLLSLAARLLA